MAPIVKSTGASEWPRCVHIGTAGWAIPKAHAGSFPEQGTGLARYAQIFNAAEINSTFYRPHRASTFERWRDSVPDEFRFAVKVPKSITHEQMLVGAGRDFAAFASSLSGLGDRLGPLLLQLPPKLAFDPIVIEAFLSEASDTGQSLVLEPRHASWSSAEADDLLARFDVARVGADPERFAGAGKPGGASKLGYLRLHGSPRIYFSSYGEDVIAALSEQMRRHPGPIWCIFDNTASGAAAGDAFRLMHALADDLKN